MTETGDLPGRFPVVRSAGVDGLLVSFADGLSEPANRAALAFRGALEAQDWDGMEETSSSLVSAYLRFDPLRVSHETISGQVRALLAAQDWYAAQLPGRRRFWRIPTVFGTALAPQLAQAAAAAGMSETQAIASLSTARVRVQTIGFAPGQPYLGELPAAWDIPRQSQLTERIPEGALAVAIRQLVLFSVTTPTGWQHVGQTAIRLFQPEAAEPFLLRAGDEVQFVPIGPEALETLRRDPRGGATCETAG
ncbi:KipI family sensor histidine kinase inhibitor [Rhodovulum imhoffii]|uniref:KipI family sensor histidine kinase inhibitor n=1 Tax=Rhodovulum imhoffii TaxID=365340 RepID=A0A2T5BTV9_9RHOB|nr:carboxyltransferase domain-containing protein [Rhodovulum imhoffii]MBK5933945.1 allophanate hydrolase [Rhodovulum imhoffii]PTN02895.1 KipI family sensor histidine kinase inhibitor [Rhodovulum imhoffii]